MRSDNTPAFTCSLMFTEPTLFTVSQSLSWILRKGGQIMQKKERKKIPFHRTHTLLVTIIPAKRRGPQAGISLSSRGRSERPVVRTWFTAPCCMLLTPTPLETVPLTVSAPQMVLLGACHLFPTGTLTGQEGGWGSGNRPHRTSGPRR